MVAGWFWLHIWVTCGRIYLEQLEYNLNDRLLLFYLFGVLRRFQRCTGHITTGSWKGRVSQYIQFVRVLHCKLLTNGKQLPVFPLEAVPGTEPRPQRWEARVLLLCHCGPEMIYRLKYFQKFYQNEQAGYIFTGYIGKPLL